MKSRKTRIVRTVLCCTGGCRNGKALKPPTTWIMKLLAEVAAWLLYEVVHLWKVLQGLNVVEESSDPIHARMTRPCPQECL